MHTSYLDLEPNVAVRRFSSIMDHRAPLGYNGWQVHPAVVRNVLLGALSDEDFGLLQPLLEAVALPVRTCLAVADTPIEHAYFLTDGIASIVAATAGHRVEVGIVGREGMTGVPLILGTDRAPQETFVQTSGAALRIGAADLRQVVAASASLQGQLLRYAQALTTR